MNDAAEPMPAIPDAWAPAAGALQAYHDLLATAGVERGLIGPREVPRLWTRHILNSAVLSEVIDSRATVIDVGSGAGLPGLPLAIVRPDLTVVLLEPLLRRATFLSEAVEQLGLADRVSVERGRAEERAGTLSADVVTARAVAPLDRLAGWCLPLTNLGGAVLALKGEQAADEIESARPRLAALGGAEPDVITCGAGVVDPVTTVVRIRRINEGTRRRSKR